MLKRIAVLSLSFLFLSLLLQAQHIEILQQGTHTSIRGLSVVDDHIAWVSGSKGYISITNDGGKTWTSQQLKGFEQAHFRDIEAFSDKEAVIISSGTPALILKTTDGGANWEVKYHNTDTSYFLDAMDFTDHKHGYILGDPIKGSFLLLETKDSGESWHPFNNPPKALPGEAAFAASGTCIRTYKNKGIMLVTGGTVARCLATYPPYKTWRSYDLPLTHGLPSKGAFSIAANKNWIVAGGDYSKDKSSDSVSCINDNAKSEFRISKKGPSGYQSCVEYIGKDTFLSTGTSGSNITTNSGKTWAKIDNTSYNVCRKANNGKLILLAGDSGKIGIYIP